MTSNRRKFLGISSCAVGALALASTAAVNDAFAQQQAPEPPPFVDPSNPHGPRDKDGSDLPNRGNTAKAILTQNQADIKKSVEKLYDLAAQLKDQVNSTDSTAVLSMALVKKADEIEKLAKLIKDRAKG